MKRCKSWSDVGYTAGVGVWLLHFVLVVDGIGLLG